jgi:hypothetical protein
MPVTKNSGGTLSLSVVRPRIETRQTMTRLEWRQWKNGSLMYSAMDARACFIAALPTLSSRMQTGREMVTLLWVTKSLIIPVGLRN